ncbi:MAG: hypothetical protein COX19_09730 [Desulfobacterales bacterium CG23_combo_of_CG06-09_8_20_14_all_51_8]|nr:MAG: hypothetical protein COX19_09730 [Desulfobacterales bacterium CG23_combo_of_CG06-09_8_20_14_all_51_8]
MTQEICAPPQEFAFDALPVSVEMIQAHIQRFFPHTQEKGNWVQSLLLKTALTIVRWMPAVVAWWLGLIIGNILYFLKLRSHVAMVNLDIVYGGAKSASEKRAIYRASMVNFGHVIINYMRLPFAGKDFWANHCELVNEAVLKEAINRKRGVLFIGGHIGMWDMAGGKVGMSGYPTSVVGKKIGNPVINEFVAKARSSMNMGQILNKNTMAQILEGLARGEATVLAIDQNMKKDRGVFVDWMGRPASSVKSTTYMVKKSGAAVIPGFMIQTGPKAFQVILGEEINWVPCPEDPERELLINTQNQARAVQAIILQHPELWFWIHKRWKIRPEGEKDLYA